MPCNTVTTNKIQWKATTDPKLLKLAFEQMGLKVIEIGGEMVGVAGRYDYRVASYNDKTHTLTTYSNPILNFTEADYKVGYSNQVVQRQAKMAGWQIKKTAKNKYELTRSTM
jgi:hypothetical protein